MAGHIMLATAENNNAGFDAGLSEGDGLTALKLPPHSIEAEQSVLGGLMLSQEAWDSVADTVSEKDFYRTAHRLIFRAIEQLVNSDPPQSVDALTVSEALRLMGRLDEAGGLAYLGELVRNTPSALNLRAYGRIVRERSVLRQLIGASHEIAENAYQPKGRESSELIDLAEQKIFAIAENRAEGGPQAIPGVLTRVVDRIGLLAQNRGSLTGVSTGFRDLDGMTSGLQKGELVIVAARPSMGKTTFAMNLVEDAVMHSNKPVLVFSLEMPADALVMRMLSSLGRINLQRLLKGDLHDEDWPRFTSAMQMLSERQLFIDDSAGLTPTELRARARRVAREHGELSMIMVDYLQLMRVEGMEDNRVNEISMISRSLKALAKELSVPVVALSQLSRAVESRTDKRPMMSDLRESGAIEQDADVIMFIFRPEVYEKEKPELKGRAEIIIGKQRNGPIGKVHLSFLGEFTRFEDAADMSYADFGGGE